MAHVFALINQKGGIGKTTVSAQLGAGLARRGYKTLLIDMDAQCNLTFSMKGDYSHHKTIMDLILDRVDDYEEVIQHLDEADLIAGSPNLSTLEQRIDPDGREFYLDTAIDCLKDDYDYIIIDSPPTISLITVGIMCAADSLIIPVSLDMYSLQGTGQLYKTYVTVKTYCNSELKIDGLLINSNNQSRTLSKTLESIAKTMNVRIFNATISRSTLIKHATIKRESIFKYAPESKVAKEFDSFIEELLSIRNKKGAR